MKRMPFVLVLLLSFATPSQAGNVTAISVPVGGTIHVTVLQAAATVAPTTITWTSNGVTQVGTITPDATGFNFVGTIVGTATAVATHSGDNASGTLLVTVTSATAAPLTFTSP